MHHIDKWNNIKCTYQWKEIINRKTNTKNESEDENDLENDLDNDHNNDHDNEIKRKVYGA